MGESKLKNGAHRMYYVKTGEYPGSENLGDCSIELKKNTITTRSNGFIFTFKEKERTATFCYSHECASEKFKGTKAKKMEGLCEHNAESFKKVCTRLFP